MPKKKPYSFHICKDCEIDFLVTAKLRSKVNCPKCADNLYVEKLKEVWLDRHINYKRPWTKEEDETLLISIEQGYPREDIAIALDRTTKAVYRRSSQLKKRNQLN